MDDDDEDDDDDDEEEEEDDDDDMDVSYPHIRKKIKGNLSSPMPSHNLPNPNPSLDAISSYTNSYVPLLPPTNKTKTRTKKNSKK